MEVRSRRKKPLNKKLLMSYMICVILWFMTFLSFKPALRKTERLALSKSVSILEKVGVTPETTKSILEKLNIHKGDF